MQADTRLFGRERALVGMVHLGALPGTPRSTASVRTLTATACDEAVLLADVGFDAIMLENMHDVPYLRRTVGPEIVASMTAIARAVREAVDLPLGVQILAGANHAALAVAHAVEASFVRTEGFVFASVADEGLIDDADAGPLLRFRRQIGAEDVMIFADVQKKHSAHAITADIDIAAMTHAADFFGADGIIITGPVTGQPIRVDDLGTARVSTAKPLLVGSGVTPDSADALLAYADGLIVGSWYKRDGVWSNPPDPQRARDIVRAVHG